MAATASRYMIPLNASYGPAACGKAEVEPRNQLCTPSISVIGEKRPSQPMTWYFSWESATACTLETAP